MENKNKLTSVKTAIRLSRQILIIASLKGMTDLNNRDFDPFGDFFNDLNNFRPSSNTPPTPPTQSGWRLRWKWSVMVPKIVGPAQTPPPSQEKRPAWNEFGINVTEIARRGDIDPVYWARR